MPRLDANGSSDEYVIQGSFTYHLSDDFGTGTVVLQFEDESGTFVTIANTSTTTAVDKLYTQSDDASGVFRLTLSGSTSPDLLYNIKGNARIKGQS